MQPLLGLSTRDPRINNNVDRENDKMNETMQSSGGQTTDVQFQRFAIVADDFLFSLILERTLFAQDGECLCSSHTLSVCECVCV